MGRPNIGSIRISTGVKSTAANEPILVGSLTSAYEGVNGSLTGSLCPGKYTDRPPRSDGQKAFTDRLRWVLSRPRPLAARAAAPKTTSALNAEGRRFGFTLCSQLNQILISKR